MNPTVYKSLSLAFVIALTLLVAKPTSVFAQFGQDDVIIHEFFSDVLRITPGAAANVFDVERSDNITHIAIADSGTAFVVNFTEIWKISGGTVSDFYEIDGVSPREITIDLNGDVLACSGSVGIIRIDADTGTSTTVFDDSFFSPTDICVSSEGFIYASEFFDGLGRVSPGGGWSKIGDWPTNFFNHIDMGPDGYLYCTTTFEEGDVYKVNPVTGQGTKIGDNVYTFIDDIAVASDGKIYLAGATNTDDDDTVENMVLYIDPEDYSINIVVDENQVGDPQPPFFNPMDIEIFNGVFFQSAAGEFAPESITVNRGQVTGGSLADLVESDNVDLSIARQSSDIQPRTEFEVSMTSQTSLPTELTFTLEASVFARSTVVQSIWLFNYDTDSYEQIDSRNAQRFSDNVVNVDPSGDLSRFVQPGTNRVEAQIRYQSLSPRQQFTSNVDQVRWTIR